MRKLGIVIAIAAAATLGFAGTALADGHEEQLCDPVDEVTQQIVDGGLPIPETQDGLVETCKQSNSTDGLAVSPLLCGLETDVTTLIAPELGGAVDAVHSGINELENQALSQVPLPLLKVEYPCPTGPDSPDPTGAPGNGGGGGPEVQGATVQQQNAAADGSLPRTGGELFAGAGFALMSLGALVRRFLP